MLKWEGHMSNELFFEANDRNIKEALFQKYIFKIPRYQRPYAWTEDEVAELWNDINDENESIFLGSFIFNHEPLEKNGYIEVVDGQQRILTITILVAVIRDIANQIDEGLADYFHRDMIVMEESYHKYIPRIICGDSTRPFFERYIQTLNKKLNENIQQANPANNEERLIKSNYMYFFNKINNVIVNIDGNDKKLEYLNKLINKIERVIVIYIKIAREEDAYEIFETTNARGVDLNVADLLKNWIFKNIRSDGIKDLAKEVWQDIESNVQGDLRRFLRYYWISSNPFVTERKLYKAIKGKVVDWESFLDNLWKASDIYNMLIHPSEEQWSASNYLHQNKLYKSINALKLMDVSQCYVLLLSVLINYERLHMDPYKIFEKIEKFSFLYSAVSKQPGNKVEKLYSSYALRLTQIISAEEKDEVISTKVNQLFQQLGNELKENIPTRDMFIRSFCEIKYKATEQNRQFIKYILSEINNFWEVTNEHKIDFNNVNIEHIIPQNPDTEWHLDKKDIKEYVNNLGNLTLLDKDINSRAGNRSLSKKLELLRLSQLPITKKIVEDIQNQGNTWNNESIIERQRSLAELAYDKVWKL
mgnify:CR=1 FL=1